MRTHSIFVFLVFSIGLVSTSYAKGPNACDAIKCATGYTCVSIRDNRAAQCVKEAKRCRNGYLLDIDNNCVPAGTHVR